MNENKNELSIYDICDELNRHKATNHLVTWFGDYGMNVPAPGVSDNDILRAYEMLKEQEVCLPKQRLFVDMDGTVARFHDEVQYLERMFEKDFFRNLKPFEEACNAISELVRSGNYDVYILSAAVDGEPPYCRTEKAEWIKNNLPGIDSSRVIFTKVGQDKANFIPDGIRSTDILLDDYTKNLLEWERAGGIGIKAKNNINCRGLFGEPWNGALVDITQSSEQICTELDNAIEQELEDECEL